MRILILAGIHSNLSAFEAVLKDAQGQWDRVWCLGNVIGYGLEPNECLELLQTLPHVAVCGIFEHAVLGNMDLRTFNLLDRHAVEWTQKTLKPEHLPLLQTFPATAKEGDFTLLHGTPRDWLHDYVTEALSATLNFPHFATRYCLCGRLPYPAIYEESDNHQLARDHKMDDQRPHQLTERRVMITTGHVGISGTQKPDIADYGLLDLELRQFHYRRCKYDAADLLRRLRNANFPELLLERWGQGYF
jgi:predicted phosphodiesterase